MTVEAAARLLDAERQTGRTVTVISQHRFDESSRRVHEAVSAGQFGTLTSAVASVAWWRSQAYYDSGEWRGTLRLDGGGAVMNQSIHTVDLLVWMLGEPVEVYAQTGRLAHEGIEVEDTCVATIRFASGALGVVHATTAAYPGLTARLQVHGSRGSAVIDDDRLVYFHVGDGDAPDYGAGDAAGTGGAPRTAGSEPSALSDAHTAQYEDFIAAIAQGRPPFVTVAQARTTLAVVAAMYASADSGQPIQLA